MKKKKQQKRKSEVRNEVDLLEVVIEESQVDLSVR